MRLKAGERQFRIGKVVRQLRKGLGVSQDTLAMAIGAHQQTVASWENDSRQMRLDSFIRICTFLEVTPTQFVNLVIEESGKPIRKRAS